jgi:hypothetical protein
VKQPTVLQGKPSPQLTEYDRKVEVITAYVEKFAAIANRPVTPQVYQAYIEALEDFDERRLRKGLEEYLKCGTQWPWPGHLREFIEEEV